MHNRFAINTSRVSILPTPEMASSKHVVEMIGSPARLSFSSEFLDESKFISIGPHGHDRQKEEEAEKAAVRSQGEFEFLSGKLTDKMITADELFCEGKLLPFWQMKHAEKQLGKMSLKTEKGQEEKNEEKESRISWFLDEDPSPRPPTCTVLWKELLRMKKQRLASTLSLSSSGSSSSSSSSSSAEIASADEMKEGLRNRDKVVKRIKKGLERTRLATVRIRPVINTPVSTKGKNTNLPPPFPWRKGRFES